MHNERNAAETVGRTRTGIVVGTEFSNRSGRGNLSRAGFQFVETLDWPISPNIRHYCIVLKKPNP
jgi:hypothetical protein